VQLTFTHSQVYLIHCCDEQTLVVTVTNNPDNDGKFHITTADAFSTPENTNKVITLATNNKDPLMYNVFEIIDGEDANKVITLFVFSGVEKASAVVI
jgi:hypothetical protein